MPKTRTSIALRPSIEEGVLHCVVSDATRGNSLSGPSIAGALDYIRDSGPGTQVRAILLTGGDNFCNGGDVTAFAAAIDPGQFVGDLAERFHEFILALTEAPVPVVAAVRGWAAGAGMSIACASDIVVAGPSSGFLPAYGGLGFSPDGGMTWTLARKIGAGRAADTLLTGTAIEGGRARDIGLVTRFVGDTEIEGTARLVASRIARSSATAAAATKRLLTQSALSSFAEHLQREAESISGAARSEDGREGVSAFVARRKPKFA